MNRNGYDLARPVPAAVFMSHETLSDMGLTKTKLEDVIVNVWGMNLRPKVDDVIVQGHLLVRMTNGDLMILEIGGEPKSVEGTHGNSEVRRGQEQEQDA